MTFLLLSSPWLVALTWIGDRHGGLQGPSCHQGTKGGTLFRDLRGSLGTLLGVPPFTLLNARYMHSLRYVINAPAPPRVAPDNSEELFVDICINILALMVLGTAVSKISSTSPLQYLALRWQLQLCGRAWQRRMRVASWSQVC